MRHARTAVGTANDRLKHGFGDRLWASLAAAAVLHFAVLAFWPQMTVAAPGLGSAPVDLVPLREMKVPPPPDELPRPAVPMVSTDLEIDPDVTIPPTTFEDVPVAPPQPRMGSGVGVSDRPVWTPYEVKPELRNAREYLRALEGRYPPMLRDAGVGGTVVLWVHLDETGSVLGTRVAETSGYAQLDLVAEELMREVARFRPALNRDQPVRVWVQIPVTFEAR